MFISSLGADPWEILFVLDHWRKEIKQVLELLKQASKV
jgi:hypothetical protein